MTGALPEALLAELAGTGETQGWQPIFQLLTAAGGAAPDVCLLSRVEIEATTTSVDVAARSTRAAANLRTDPHATLVAWAGQLHYVSLELRRTTQRENVCGYGFAVREVRVDDIGVPTSPMRYEMNERLAVVERWSLTAAVLEELADASR